MPNAMLLPPRAAANSVRVPALSVPQRLDVAPLASVMWYRYDAPQYAGDSRPTVPVVAS